MVSCVISGTVTPTAVAMTNAVTVANHLREPDATWEKAKNTFTVTDGTVFQLNADANLPVSPYKWKFRQGAILWPRVLVTVEDAPQPRSVPAPAPPGAVRRTTAEKVPWKYVPRSWVRRDPHVLLRTWARPSLGIRARPDPDCPSARHRPTPGQSEIAENPGSPDWWTQAEAAWDANKVQNDYSDLLTRIDYHAQLPRSCRSPASAWSTRRRALAAARWRTRRR